MQSQPMIVVRDVRASSRFYAAVLDAASGHGGAEYEQIVRNGVMLLQLHDRDAHGHPHLIDDATAVGNGVLLWFSTDAFDAAVQRLARAGVSFLEPPHVNTLANHRECMFLDPDGYKVVFASEYGDIGTTS